MTRDVINVKIGSGRSQRKTAVEMDAGAVISTVKTHRSNKKTKMKNTIMAIQGKGIQLGSGKKVGKSIIK